MKTLLVLVLLTLKFATLDSVKAQNLDEPTDEEPEPQPVTFTFSSFAEVDRENLKFVFDADILVDKPNRIELTPFRADLVNATDDGDVKGKVFYKNAIKMKDKASRRTVSFSTQFTITIKSENLSDAGDGLAFVLVADPDFEGDAEGQFGIFKSAAAPSSTVAVEFDTFKNKELMDTDANHVGVDIDSALSLLSTSASKVKINLNEGVPITAWIDYSAEEKIIQVRISDDRNRPSRALISGSLDLSLVLSSKMWVGFSAATNMAAHQSHEISFWTFQCDSLPESEGSSVLEKMKRLWKSVGSYVVCAVGAAIVVSLIVCMVSCFCCKKRCPCLQSCCSCCTRWCPCLSRCTTCCSCSSCCQSSVPSGTSDKKCCPSSCCPSSCCSSPCCPSSCCPPSCCPCLSCKCKCSNCCKSTFSKCCPCSKCCPGTRTTPPPPPPPPPPPANPMGPDKEKSCPQAFLEMIQEDVSTEKDMDLTLKLPEGLRACLPPATASSFSTIIPFEFKNPFPFTNPFSTQQVLQPGCVNSLLFGPDSDDELEAELGAEARASASASTPPSASAPAPAVRRGSLMMVSNTVFDMPPEEAEEVCSPCPEHCPGRMGDPSAVDCLIGDNCLIESTAKAQQQLQAASPPATPRALRTREPEAAATGTARYEDFTPQEQIAMGWGFFSP